MKSELDRVIGTLSEKSGGRLTASRAGGVSIGINLNTNNACNWRCIYCQVPELARGTAPPIDLLLLEKELAAFVSKEDGGFTPPNPRGGICRHDEYDRRKGLNRSYLKVNRIFEMHEFQ